MNRWCSNKFKEPSEEEPGEEEPVVDQDSARENSEAAVTSSQLEPSESDVNVEETVIPLEGRGSMNLIFNLTMFVLTSFYLQYLRFWKMHQVITSIIGVRASRPILNSFRNICAKSSTC